MEEKIKELQELYDVTILDPTEPTTKRYFDPILTKIVVKKSQETRKRIIKLQDKTQRKNNKAMIN